jgi:glycosyltransferase involved in cell wall biosynthesis
MRVLMIAPFPRRADRIDGGVAAATMYLCQALSALPDIDMIGVRVARDGMDQPEDRQLGWPVIDLPLGRMSLSTLFMQQRRRLRDLLLRYKPQLVHAQGADISGFLAVNCNLPAVVTVHGLLAACARFQTDPVNRVRASLSAAVTERPTIRRASDLIAISPFVARHYRDDIRGRIHELPNAVAPAFFELERKPERGRFLFAGRIANGKGLEELVRAAARSSQAVTKLILAGATPDRAYEDRLRRDVATLGLADRVQFAGLLTEVELLQEFARAQALVLPSHQETAPMVVQQAMAAGLAVVATNVGGIPHQIRHDVSGLLFEPGNEQALAGLLSRLGHDAEFSARLGDAAKHEASRLYRASSVAEATFGVYRTAVYSSARSANFARIG